LTVAVIFSGCGDEDAGPIASQSASDTPTPTASATPTPGPATPTPTPGEFRHLFTIPSPNEDPSLDHARAVAVDPNASVIYVANDGLDDEIWVFDEATGALQSSYPMGPCRPPSPCTNGDSPRSVEYDPVSNSILTLNVSSKVVSILDADTGIEVARVQVPGSLLRSVVVDDAGERAYVGTQSSVFVIDRETLAVTEVPVPGRVHDMAFDPATGVLYVAVECIQGPFYRAQIIEVRAQIIEDCRSGLFALDRSSGELLYEILLEQHSDSELAIDSASQTAYVMTSLFEPEGLGLIGVLLVVDLESRAVRERVDLPWQGGSTIVVDETQRMVYIAAFNNLVLLDADTYEVLRTIEGGLEPSDMAVNSTTGRVYVSSGSGTVVFGR